jgi:ATP phosphoribosyltransferase regulatory subunit
VAHTLPAGPHATREPLQFGAEIYGHRGLEADLEILQLALDSLKAAKVQSVCVDLADARIVRAVLQGVVADHPALAQVHQALASKDRSELAALTLGFPSASRQALLALVELYGDASVLAQARTALSAFPAVDEALASLKWLASHLDGVTVSYDLADMRGYGYYSGARFSMYAPGAHDALVRGGRYDQVGAVFGRNRPAAGFSLDVKALVGAIEPRTLHAAIRAPWSERPALRGAIATLRQRGETVVCVLPGHESEIDEFHCDRELVQIAGQWVVQSI